MKRVYSSHNQVLVHHFRNVLEAAGIATELRNLRLASAMGELPPAECQAEVWVDEKDASSAYDLIFRAKISGPDWTCKCGEISGPQFTHCWKCGSARVSL